MSVILPHHYILDVCGRDLETCLFSSQSFRSGASPTSGTDLNDDINEYDSGESWGLYLA